MPQHAPRTGFLSKFKRKLWAVFPSVMGFLYARRTKLQRFTRRLRKERFGVETLRNFVIDRRYGGYCGGRVPSRFAHLNAFATASVDYYQLSRLFDPSQNGVSVGELDVLVDVGSGKGRVINFWLHNGFSNTIYALELDRKIAEPAADRLRKYKNVTVLCGDAIDLLPQNGTLFFLFNPFGAQTMLRFKEAVTKIAEKNPAIRILYFKCDHLQVFKNDERWRIETIDGLFYAAALMRFNG